MSKSCEEPWPGVKAPEGRGDPGSHLGLPEALGRHRRPLDELDHHHVEVLEHLDDPGGHAGRRRGGGVVPLVRPIHGEQLRRGTGDPHDVAISLGVHQVVGVGQAAGELGDGRLAAAPHRDASREPRRSWSRGDPAVGSDQDIGSDLGGNRLAEHLDLELGALAQLDRE